MTAPDQTNAKSLTRILSSFAIGNDKDYDALLTGQKYLTSLTAPEAFRALLKNLAPFRFDLSRGIESDGKTMRFFWFIGEFGAEGSAEEMRARIAAPLVQAGFKGSPVTTGDRGYPISTYKFEDEKTSHEITLEGPKRFIGTKTERSGGSLTYAISIKEPFAELIFEDVIAAVPAFACSAIPEEFGRMFPGKPVARVSYGGTWERYYDWTYVFHFGSAKEADAFLQGLTETALKLNFNKEREEGGAATFMKKNATEPVIYLEKESALLVSFRIQPHT